MAGPTRKFSIVLDVDGTKVPIEMTRAQQAVLNGAGAIDESLKKISSGGIKMGEGIKQGSHAGVTSVQALGGAIRGIDGSLNVRAAERWLASFSGLAAVAKAAFPVFGALAVVDIFSSMIEKGKKMYDEFVRLKDISTAIKSSFQAINTPLEISNSELKVANDQLDNEIAKLSGKPQNGLKLALDQAIVSSEKLSKSLSDNLSELQKVLKENSVSWIAGALTEQAPTGATDDRVKAANKKAANINAGFDFLTPHSAEEKAADEQARSASLLQLYRDQASEARKSLSELNAKRAASDKVAATTGEGGPGYKTTYYDADISKQQALLRNANENIDRYALTQDNQAKTKQKDKLSADNSAADLTRPFADKTKELAAQIDGLKDKLKAVGADGTAEIMAKAYADWKEALVKLNDELGKHHQQVTAAQSAQLEAQFVTIEQTKAELEWQEAFKKSTTAIDEKTQALIAQAAAIGQGYAAQKAYNVEAELASKLGAHANDPAWMAAHSGNINSLRSQLGAQYDASQSEKTGQDLDKLQDQIELENSLAAAEKKGSEAVREATLQHRLAKIAQDNSVESTQKLKEKTEELAESERKRSEESTIATLQQQIEATKRLTAAQIHGSAAVRQAQLDNRIAEIKRSTLAGPGQDKEIEQATQQSAAQHQLDIAAAAMKTGLEYKNQLQSLQEQIAYLEQQKAIGHDSLELEISLRDLEKERAKIWSELVQEIGDAKDGLKAYFAELKQSGESTAKIVHDSLAAVTDGLNENLSKLMTGEKTNWKSTFRGVAQGVAKSGLKSAEASLAGLFGVHADGGKPTGAKDNPLYVVIAGGSGQSVAGGLGQLGDDSGGDSGASSGLFKGIGAGIFGKLGGPLKGGSSGLGSMIMSLAGGFADGGDVNTGGNYLVGERGPEILSIPGGSHVTPNHKIDEMSGGGFTQVINVDARGTDPVAAAQHTRRAMANAVKATHERAARTPKR